MNEKIPGWPSTLCGSLLTVVITLDLGDLVTSAVLAAMGTAVSYAITRLMKVLFE